ncbi:MAG: hypothetical protein M0Z56_00240 [Desulfobacteraceae bacterium]|nr:hypothetical protein [Desulfobacteraceae bacterium]
MSSDSEPTDWGHCQPPGRIGHGEQLFLLVIPQFYANKEGYFGHHKNIPDGAGMLFAVTVSNDDQFTSKRIRGGYNEIKTKLSAAGDYFNGVSGIAGLLIHWKTAAHQGN